jgi:hypothetical protein
MVTRQLLVPGRREGPMNLSEGTLLGGVRWWRGARGKGAGRRAERQGGEVERQGRVHGREGEGGRRREKEGEGGRRREKE